MPVSTGGGMKINTIIWDIGGVLERTEDLAPRQQVADRLGMSVADLSALIFGDTTQFRVQLGHISREEHFRYVQAELGLATQAELDRVLAKFFGGDRLDTNLVEHIRELKTSYTTAVLSNYSEILREKITHNWQIGDAFDHLIISAEVGHKKPKPEIYQIALEKAGCQPGEAVFIDDFIENVRAARQLGIHGIHFRTVEQTLDELSNLLTDPD
jgi:putative hydrolase of the HAD superfamily